MMGCGCARYESGLVQNAAGRVPGWERDVGGWRQARESDDEATVYSAEERAAIDTDEFRRMPPKPGAKEASKLEGEKREDPRLVQMGQRLEADGYRVGFFWVPRSKLGVLEKEIARLGKRTKKLGLRPIVFEKGTPYHTKLWKRTVHIVEGTHGPEERSEEREVMSEVTPVLIAGDEPRLKGWRLIAALDYDEASANGGPWLRVVPGETLPAEYRTVDPTRCDQCKTKRDRTTVFVLKHEDGRYAVIGRTCLTDFLGGHGDPMAIANGAETLFALFDLARGMEDGGGGGGGRADYAAPMGEFMTYVVAVIDKIGWMSRAVARDRPGVMATADAAWNSWDPVSRARAMQNAKRDGYPDWFILEEPAEAQKERAQAVVDWATAEFVDVDPTNLTDYGYNCRSSLLAGVVTSRSAGIVASLASGYGRSLQQKIEKEKRGESVHFGTVGERIVLDLTFTFVKAIDGIYGTTYLCSFLTPEGNVAKWFASSWSFEFGITEAQGKTVHVKATIKEHGEYKGTKETQLSRVAEVPLVAPPKAPRKKKEKREEGWLEETTGNWLPLPAIGSYAGASGAADPHQVAVTIRHYGPGPHDSKGIRFVDFHTDRTLVEIPWPPAEVLTAGAGARSDGGDDWAVRLDAIEAYVREHYGALLTASVERAEALREAHRTNAELPPYVSPWAEPKPLKRGSKRAERSFTRGMDLPREPSDPALRGLRRLDERPASEWIVHPFQRVDGRWVASYGEIGKDLAYRADPKNRPPNFATAEEAIRDATDAIRTNYGPAAKVVMVRGDGVSVTSNRRDDWEDDLVPNGEDASPEQIAEAKRTLDRDFSDGDRMQINTKRGSKRGSKRRGSKRTSRPRTSGAGVMGKLFGNTVDPDAGGGRAVDRAMDRYETFHKKQPIEVVRVRHDPPRQLVPIGDALSVSYRTDKWKKDGDDIDYKHVHDPEDGRRRRYEPGGGVKLYESARWCAAETKKSNGTCAPPRSYPEAWTRLGLCLGFFARGLDGDVIEVDAKSSMKNTWLLCSPDGKMLAVYSPEPQADGSVGFLCVMAGGKLDVIADGIVG